MATIPSRKEVKEAIKANQEKPKTVSKADRKRYALVKARAMELERKNNDSVIVFPAPDEPWYIMGDFSALLYAFDLGRRMKKEPKIQVDSDKGTENFEWVAFIRDFDGLKNRMAAIGFDKVEDLGDGIIKFPLGRTYTDTEKKKFFKQVQEVTENIRKLAKIEKVYPKIYTQLIRIMPVYYSRIKRMNAIDREMNGKRLWGHILKINALYHAVARGKIGARAGLEEILKYVDAIIDIDLAISNIGIWDPITSVKISKMAVELKELTEKEVNSLSKQV